MAKDTNTRPDSHAIYGKIRSPQRRDTPEEAMNRALLIYKSKTKDGKPLTGVQMIPPMFYHPPQTKHELGRMLDQTVKNMTPHIVDDEWRIVHPHQPEYSKYVKEGREFRSRVIPGDSDLFVRAMRKGKSANPESTNEDVRVWVDNWYEEHGGNWVLSEKTDLLTFMAYGLGEGCQCCQDRSGDGASLGSVLLKLLALRNSRRIGSLAVDESAPPTEKAERFVKSAKGDFRTRYGDRWKQVLYATAWKRFGLK